MTDAQQSQTGLWYVKWLRHSKIILTLATPFFIVGLLYTGELDWVLGAVLSPSMAVGFHAHQRSIESIREVYDDLEY